MAIGINTGMAKYPQQSTGLGAAMPQLSKPKGLGLNIGGSGAATTPWWNNATFGKAATGLGALGLAIPGLQEMLSGMDFKPTFTADTAQQMTQSAEQRMLSELATKLALGRRDAGSQYMSRGLGSSGEAIKDIADYDVQGAAVGADIEAQMQAQLSQLLQYIDQRDFQQAMYEDQVQKELWGSLLDLGGSAAMFAFL